MIKVSFDRNIDAIIMRIIANSKDVIVNKLKYSPIYSLDRATYYFVVDCAEGLRGLKAYQRRAHIDGAGVFISRFRKEIMLTWHEQTAMAEQMIDHAEVYFPNYTIAMMRSYFTVAQKVNESELIRLEGIGNLVMQHFGCDQETNVPDVKENLLSYLDCK